MCQDCTLLEYDVTEFHRQIQMFWRGVLRPSSEQKWERLWSWLNIQSQWERIGCLLRENWCLGETCCFRIWGRRGRWLSFWRNPPFRLHGTRRKRLLNWILKHNVLLKLWYLSTKQQSIKSAEAVFVARIIPQRRCVQILPYETNLLHSKKVIAAVDVSKIKVNFILCYWACVLYATHMINPLQTKRRPLYLKTQSVPRCKHFSSRL